MALNSVYRVRTQATYLNQNVEFGVHIQDTAGTGSAAHLASTWRDAMLTVLTAAVTAQVSWTQVTVNDTNPNGELSHILPIVPAVPGTQTGSSLPPQNAAVISLLTGLKGKRRSGRYYLPGLAEESTANGVITEPQFSAIWAVAQQMLAVFGASGSDPVYTLVVYSPPTRPYVAPTPPPVHTDTLITPVASARLGATVRTQRRRAIGVGR